MYSTGNILKSFGFRLKQIRKERGLTQESLSEVCKLDRSYIGGVERGERNISLRNIEIIAQALKITVSELMKDL